MKGCQSKIQDEISSINKTERRRGDKKNTEIASGYSEGVHEIAETVLFKTIFFIKRYDHLKILEIRGIMNKKSEK